MVQDSEWLHLPGGDCWNDSSGCQQGQVKEEKETYIVRYDVPIGNGYWRMNVEEEVSITSQGAKIKNNHLTAQKLIEKKYPGCRVGTVTYV